jgi:hypothetical protein
LNLECHGVVLIVAREAPAAELTRHVGHRVNAGNLDELHLTSKCNGLRLQTIASAHIGALSVSDTLTNPSRSDAPSVRNGRGAA